MRGNLISLLETSVDNSILSLYKELLTLYGQSDAKEIMAGYILTHLRKFNENLAITTDLEKRLQILHDKCKNTKDNEDEKLRLYNQIMTLQGAIDIMKEDWS